MPFNARRVGVLARSQGHPVRVAGPPRQTHTATPHGLWGQPANLIPPPFTPCGAAPRDLRGHPARFISSPRTAHGAAPQISRGRRATLIEMECMPFIVKNRHCIMPRIPHKLESRRSERLMRIVANEGSPVFQRRLEQLTASPHQIEWLSPLKGDDHAEYYDSAFLDKLGLSALAPALKDFWPESGPRWDGLARTDGGEVILVEAKAHLDETITDCLAGPASTQRIVSAFEWTMSKLGTPQSRSRVSWLSPYYQLCNRIAHLCFLREHGIKAHMVFLAFADASDVPAPVSSETWRVITRHMRRSLALDKHTYRAFDHDIVISEAELNQSP